MHVAELLHYKQVTATCDLMHAKRSGYEHTHLRKDVGSNFQLFLDLRAGLNVRKFYARYEIIYVGHCKVPLVS